MAAAVEALSAEWRCEARLSRASPIVTVSDNYDALKIPPEALSRESRYTRWIGPVTLLRTQTSAMIPPLLRELALAPPTDLLLACPGLCYRRDAIDRLHLGEPHQLDLWRIRRGQRLAGRDLLRMVEVVVAALLPGRAHSTGETSHPYTQEGLEIRVDSVEIGECGLVLPALLAESGLDTPLCSGLAMGLGLDRILMLRKGLDDVRLIRATDPRIRAQMADLSPYRPVSRMPKVVRDLSLAVSAEETVESLGDSVRETLGEASLAIESVEIVTETPLEALPIPARERLGIVSGQKNVLLRLVIRDLERTLTSEEGNRLRDRVYAALHRGTTMAWVTR